MLLEDRAPSAPLEYLAGLKVFHRSCPYAYLASAATGSSLLR